MRRWRKTVRPRGAQGPWRALLPGLVILAIGIAASTIVFFLDTIRRALAEGPDIVVVADEARGLTPGADVWVAGSPSGRVTRVLFADPEGPAESRVVIHATLHRTAAPFIRSGAAATIASSSLLAPIVLKLSPGDPAGPPFDFADTLVVPAARTTDHLLALADTARGAVDTLATLARTLTDALAHGSGSAAAFRADSSLATRMQRMAHRMESVSGALRSDSSLPARAAADSLGPRVAKVLNTLRSLGDGGLSPEVSDAVLGLAQRLELIAENLDRIDRDLRSGKGTAGRALYDDELARQQEAARARLDSVKAELRRQPWRWLRVRLF